MTSGLRWTKEEFEAFERRRSAQQSQLKSSDERQGRLSAAEERIRVREHLPTAAPRKESKIERRFEQQLLERPLIPPHQRNYFFLPDRDFELDFAWPALKVAVEIQGMAHRVKGRFKADIEKRALAQLAGWRVLELDGDSVRSGRGLEWLVGLLGKA